MISVILSTSKGKFIVWIDHVEALFPEQSAHRASHVMHKSMNLSAQESYIHVLAQLLAEHPLHSGNFWVQIFAPLEMKSC